MKQNQIVNKLKEENSRKYTKLCLTQNFCKCVSVEKSAKYKLSENSWKIEENCTILV